MIFINFLQDCYNLTYFFEYNLTYFFEIII